MSDLSTVPASETSMIEFRSESIITRLAKTAPTLEVWWDSSPLVFESWAKKLVAGAPPEQQAELAEQVRRLYDPAHPTESIFRGVTTNPPLSLNAIQDDPARWKAWIRDYCSQHPGAPVEQVFWVLYKEIVRLGAQAFLPIYQASGYRYGHLSGQVDPRDAFDAEKMLAQALDLSTLSPNMMIKIPATREGVWVMGELTARGISTNATLGYVVAQFKAVAESVQAGLLRARADGVDLTGWRSVVTQMSTRWENTAEFERDAAAAGVELTVEHKRWASIAIFRRAHQLFRQRAYPSKMLICSLRLGPEVDGVQRVWHLEYTAGADAVFTLPPGYISELLLQVNQIELNPTVWDEIPPEMLAELNKIAYFRRGMDEAGYSPDEFNSLEALDNTYHEFSRATEKMVAFTRETMENL